MARTHVIMSYEVLKAIDERVGARGRSRFLEEAAAEKLERLALAESLEATAGIARGSAYGHWRDGRSAAAWVRKTRQTEQPS